jgi:hypothetical protein
MSDNELNFTAPEPTPAPEYAPMPDSFAPEEPKKKVYDGNDTNSLREAAADLDKAREAKAPPKTDKVRVYQRLDTGEPIPENLTVSAEKAGRDVKLMREWEAAGEQPQPQLDKLQNIVDGMRQTFGKELPSDFIPQLQQAAEQAKQQAARLSNQYWENWCEPENPDTKH